MANRVNHMAEPFSVFQSQTQIRTLRFSIETVVWGNCDRVIAVTIFKIKYYLDFATSKTFVSSRLIYTEAKDASWKCEYLENYLLMNR